MPKKIRPQDVAAQLEWDLGDIADFCSDVMEDANDHNMAAALRAVNAGDHDLACEFIQLEKEHSEAGHFTKELQDRRNELLDRLQQALKA